MAGADIVLVVEDVDPIRGLFELLFTSRGYDVRLAHDGASALSAVETLGPGVRPALLVLDFGLPDTDTAALLKRLRSRCPHMPVLLTSGLPLDELPGWVGGYEFLAKPFGYEAVSRRVDQLLGRVAEDSAAAP